MDNWLDRAACKGKPASVFYPRNASYTLQGEKLCASCEVRPQCLDYALHHEGDGFWGGTTAAVRVVLRERRGITLDDPTYYRQPVKQEAAS